MGFRHIRKTDHTPLGVYGTLKHSKKGLLQSKFFNRYQKL